MAPRDEAVEDQTASGSSARILEAATALLLEGGYSGLSMRKVGARVGLSQAAIYRHYADKADLVGHIVEKGYARLLERLEGAAARGGPPRERLAAGMRAYIAFALDAPDLFTAVLLRDLGPASAKVEAFGGESRGRRSFTLLQSILAEGMADGSFAPADLALSAEALWACLFGLAARLALEAMKSRAGTPPRDPTALVERVISLSLAGLAAPQEKT